MIKIGDIYQTSNYGMFKFMIGNRQIDEFNSNQIKNSIAETGQLCPIVVNMDFGILDGQHRMVACQELGIPVKFIQVKVQGIYAVYEMNNKSSKWSIYDSLISGVDRGDENYIKVKEVYDEVKLSISVILKVLAHGTFSQSSGRRKNSANSVWEKFKCQKGYEIDTLNFETNKDRLKKFSEVFAYSRRKQERTASAFINHIVCHKDYDHSVMMAQLEKYGKEFAEKDDLPTTILGRIRFLSRLYNYNKNKKTVFYVDRIF